MSVISTFVTIARGDDVAYLAVVVTAAKVAP